MNHKQFFTRGIILAVVLLLSACTSPKTTPNPTSDLLSCPTAEPQSCPTAAVQAIPEMNAWRLGWTRDAANVIITFEPGDKCSMDIIHPITGSDWNTLNYEIVVNDQTYQNYLVDTFTVDPGMTLADIEAGSTSISNMPPFVHLKEVTFINPMSRTLQAAAIAITEGPFYFVCVVQDPGDLRIIETLGPLEVPANP
jgi:hypothetical protein